MEDNKANAERRSELTSILTGREGIISAMNSAMSFANSGLLSRKESKKIKEAIENYGEPGKENGVVVGIDLDKENGATTVEGKNVIVAFSDPATILATSVAHEGVHIGQAKDYIATGNSISAFDGESEGYTVAALTAIGSIDDKGRGYSVIPTANNNVSTPIWDSKTVTPNNFSQMRNAISANIIKHLANNGIIIGQKGGTASLFPGKNTSWR